MTKQKISAIVVAVLAACGVLVWVLAQAQSRHAGLANTIAAASPSVVAANAAATVPAPPAAAASADSAAANPALQRCACDCTPPVQPKHHAKVKKIHRLYQPPEPPAPPVAVAPPLLPVYSPPVVVTPPVAVGGVVPYYYSYRAYPVGNFSYYGGYGGRYWVNSAPRFMRSGFGVRVVSRGGYGYRR